MVELRLNKVRMVEVVNAVGSGFLDGSSTFLSLLGVSVLLLILTLKSILGCIFNFRRILRWLRCIERGVIDVIVNLKKFLTE